MRLRLAAVAALFALAGFAPDVSHARPPAAWPKAFVIAYQWGGSAVSPWSPTADLLLYRDGTFDAYDNASGHTGTGVWYTRRSGREIVFDMDGGPAVYVGRRTSTGDYAGTMSTVPGGPAGVWAGGYVP